MQGVSFLLLIEFDLVATFFAAVTGAWAASRRGYDLVGAFMLALVTSSGGGLLRDALGGGLIRDVLVREEARFPARTRPPRQRGRGRDRRPGVAQ